MTSWLTLITISSTQFRSPKRCSHAPSSSCYAPKSPGFYGLTNRNLQRCSFLPRLLLFFSSPSHLLTCLYSLFTRLLFSVCIPLESFHSLAKSQNASLRHKVEVCSSSYLFSGVSHFYFLYNPFFLFHCLYFALGFKKNAFEYLYVLQLAETQFSRMLNIYIFVYVCTYACICVCVLRLCPAGLQYIHTHIDIYC